MISQQLGHDAWKCGQDMLRILSFWWSIEKVIEIFWNSHTARMRTSVRNEDDIIK